MNDTFSAYLPLSKFEDQPDGTLMAWGRATQEVVDSSNEIMDYASSAPVFKQRSQENSLRSSGHNLMPLRSMHENIASGRVIQFDYDDAEKAIDIGMHIVDPVEVLKVKNHVYTGLSIGGKYLRRWPDGSSTRFTADPREISLVDAPSVPTAKLTLFKIADDVPAWLTAFGEILQEAKDLKKSQEEKQSELILKMKSLGESIGIAKRDSSPLTAPSSSTHVEYGDPANWSYPMDSTAVENFNKGVNQSAYSPVEWHILGRRITLLSGQDFTYDPTSKQIEVNMAKNDPKVTSIVSGLKSLSAQSASLAATDPNAALALLMGHIDSLDLGSPISGSNVPVKNPGVALGKAMPPQLAAAQEEAPEAEEAEEPMEEEAVEEEGDEAVEAFKSLSADVRALSRMVKMLAKRQAQPLPRTPRPAQAPQRPSADSPVGALNGLVKSVADPALVNLEAQEAEIIKALEAGGPYALLKALRAAGSEGEDGALAWQTMNNAIRKATYANLEKGGVVTASRYAGRMYG